jgi:hypothetical protein
MAYNDVLNKGQTIDPEDQSYMREEGQIPGGPVAPLAAAIPAKQGTMRSEGVIPKGPTSPAISVADSAPATVASPASDVLNVGETTISAPMPTALDTVQNSTSNTMDTHPTVNPTAFAAQAPTLPPGSPAATVVPPAPGTPEYSEVGANFMRGVIQRAFGLNAAADKAKADRLAKEQAEAESTKSKYENAAKAIGTLAQQGITLPSAAAAAAPARVNFLPPPTNFQPQQFQYQPPTIVSDQTQKENISNSGSKMNELMNNIEPYSWEYKDPDRFGHGTYHGFMAQDLQKSEIGRSMVKPTSDGILTVDTNRAVMAAMAASAVTYKEQQTLKKMINNLDKKLKK